MKKALIYGATDLAELLYEHLLQDDRSPQILGFVVDRQYIKENEYLGLPIVASDELQTYPPSDYGIYICIGYSRMNKHRERIYNLLKELNYTILSYIHPTAKVYSTKIGEGTIAFQNVLIDYKTQIGSGNIFYGGVHIAHHSKIGDFNYFSIEVCVSGHNNIGSFCFFGANSTTKDKIKISNSTLVGAATYVYKNIDNESQVIVPERSKILDKKTSFDFL